MKINFNNQIQDNKGTPLVANGERVSLGFMACQALLFDNPAERVGGAEKHSRYKMWQRLKDGGDLEITIEEAAKLKQLIGDLPGVSPLVVGQCWDLLEGIYSDLHAKAHEQQKQFDAAVDAADLPSGGTHDHFETHDDAPVLTDQPPVVAEG